MHCSVITDEISGNLADALRVCYECAIDTIELRTVDGTHLVFHDRRSLEKIRALLEESQVRVQAIASPFLKCPLWEAGSRDMAREWALLQRSLEIAHLLGAPLVRTFSFLRTPDCDPMMERATVLETLAEAVQRTEASGKILALENEHTCTVATAEEAGWLLDQIQSDAFGLIWDPGNEAMLGLEAGQGYRYVRGKRLLHLHIKDVHRSPQGNRFVKLGTGCIDYRRLFQALAADGYEGMLSLETHYQHPEGGREQATRESLAALRSLLHEICIQGG